MPDFFGHGSYTVRVLDRGGARTKARLRFSRIDWSRILDDASNASVGVPAASSGLDEEAEAVASIEEYAHEISLSRNGREFWVGPIVEPAEETSGATFLARDLFHWTDRRTLPIDRELETDLARIFETLFDDALSRDRSPNVSVFVRESGVVQKRTVKAADRTFAGGPLRELARAGLSFTTVGRRVLAGDLYGRFGSEPLRVNDLGVRNPRWSSRGLERRTEVAVIAGLPAVDGSQLVGVAGGDDSFYGLLEGAGVELSLESVNDARKVARSRLGGRQYLVAELDPRAPFGLEDLIPGRPADVRLRVGRRKVVGDFALSSISGSVTADARGVAERVTIALVPPPEAIEAED